MTNNHVVEGADEITVKLNDDRELKGRIIGTDPSTDLALIKIEGDDFPTIPVGDSDQLKVGEWVLAVGNPFNLNSTVTAGSSVQKPVPLALLPPMDKLQTSSLSFRRMLPSTKVIVVVRW